MSISFNFCHIFENKQLFELLPVVVRLDLRRLKMLEDGGSSSSSTEQSRKQVAIVTVSFSIPKIYLKHVFLRILCCM